MTKAHAKLGLAEAEAGAFIGATSAQTPMPSEPIDAATQREGVRDFIRAMSAELSVLAHRNGFESLALIFEMARENAEADAEGLSARF
jgi:hypothetical protein